MMSVWALALLLGGRAFGAAAPEPVALPARLADGDLAAIADVAARALGVPSSGAVASPLMSSGSGPVYVVLRRRGRVLSASWKDGGAWESGLRQAVADAARRAPAGAPDTVEVCLTHSYRELALSSASLSALETSRGLLGLELSNGRRREALSPTDAVTLNRGFSEQLSRFHERWGASPEGVSARVFEAYQVLVRLKPAPRAVRLQRGHGEDDHERLDAAALRAMGDGLAGYLARSVGTDGAFPYLYEPGTDVASERGLIMVRPMLALWALGQAARSRGGVYDSAFHRALAHYLSASYRVDGGRGYVAQGERRPLGPIAFLALTLLDEPAAPSAALASLDRTIESLQEPDGSLRPAFGTPYSALDVNFYPGEALLYWATAYDRRPEARLLSRLQRAFQYYRRWYRDPGRRRPAFIPWQTRAFSLLWRRTRDPALRKFVFEMNDWLLEMQPEDAGSQADFAGQFWNPRRLEYGAFPHVSSTAVYVESLVEAFDLARQAGDAGRQRRYRRAILRGLASIRRHQFREDLDFWYVPAPEKTRGGVRGAMYDDGIRIDSVAESLMAVDRVLAFFGPRDFLLSFNKSLP